VSSAAPAIFASADRSILTPRLIGRSADDTASKRV
jgi:hypothetical protein